MTQQRSIPGHQFVIRFGILNVYGRECGFDLTGSDLPFFLLRDRPPVYPALPRASWSINATGYLAFCAVRLRESREGSAAMFFAFPNPPFFFSFLGRPSSRTI